MSRPTIRDVAALSGVSLKTVSRVLNEEPGVRPDTMQRVLDAVAELRFQRNEAAANLRRRNNSTRIVGLVTEDVANPFYSAVAGAIESVARQHRHLLLVASSGENPARERELVEAFCARRVVGLIIVPAGGDHSYLEDEIAAGTPVVFVDRPGLPGRVDSVVTENAEGARAGVTHLLNQGHARIAFLGDSAEIYTAVERHRGYRQALEDAGVTLDYALVRFGPHDVALAEQAARELLALPEPPTAIFAGNNRLTIGSVRAIQETGRRVALVGFDDFEMAEYLDPPVTVLAQDPEALGRNAAELLFDRLAGDGGEPRLVTIGAPLVVRGSGEIAYSDGGTARRRAVAKR
jgi:LacI family transcriptional regulator